MRYSSIFLKPLNRQIENDKEQRNVEKWEFTDIV